MIHSLNCADYLDHIAHLKKEGALNYDRDTKYWGNIPIEHTHLYDLYTIFEQGYKFLDLGCGAGNVLRFAQNAGYEVTGVELDEALFKYLEGYNYFSNDMRKLSPDFYSEYDVIYSYSPLKEGMQLFVDKVIASMKIGAYLVLPFRIVRNRNMKLIGRGYYKKIAK